MIENSRKLPEGFAFFSETLTKDRKGFYFSGELPRECAHCSAKGLSIFRSQKKLFRKKRKEKSCKIKTRQTSQYTHLYFN